MNLKTILKISLLVLGLIVVFVAKNATFSPKFKDEVAKFFGVYSQRYITWCADHVVDVSVIDPIVSPSFKNLPMTELREKYCSLPVENINHIDLDSVAWTVLFESAGATGIKTHLQWNEQMNLFRFKGLPFKSTALAFKLKQR
jgi:hypothetical protein